jgi:TfoX N-terminal domain
VAFDEGLAERIRALLEARPDLGEQLMFGGIAFMVGGNMCCGVNGDDLVVRLDPDRADELLESEAGVRPFDMTGRPMRGWILVGAEGVSTDPRLERWVARGAAFARSLPPKG